MTLNTLIKILSVSIYMSRFAVILNILLMIINKSSGQEIPDIFLMETLLLSVAWYLSESALDQAYAQLELDKKHQKKKDTDESAS